MNITELQARLASAFGPPGREQPVSDAIRGIAEKYADEITSDVMGNLIVYKKSRAAGAKKLMLCAHMDSVGFVVTHIEKEGFLRFAALGGIDPRRLSDAAVIFANGTRGVVGCEGAAEPDKLKIDNLYIDIGADDENTAKQCVNVSDMAVYRADTFTQNGKLFSSYLDDRIGCAVLLEALSRVKDCKNDLYFVFSAQEELGGRGAKTAAYSIMPDFCVNADVTPTGDMPEPKTKLNVRLGGGAAIKIADSSVLCHPKAIRLLEETAAAKNIPVQREVMKIGGTDTSVIQRTGAGVVSGGISIPSRYTHGALETADLRDIAAAADLLTAVLDAEL